MTERIEIKTDAAHFPPSKALDLVTVLNAKHARGDRLTPEISGAVECEYHGPNSIQIDYVFDPTSHHKQGNQAQITIRCEKPDFDKVATELDRIYNRGL